VPRIRSHFSNVCMRSVTVLVVELLASLPFCLDVLRFPLWILAVAKSGNDLCRCATFSCRSNETTTIAFSPYARSRDVEISRSSAQSSTWSIYAAHAIHLEPQKRWSAGSSRVEGNQYIRFLSRKWSSRSLRIKQRGHNARSQSNAHPQI
jgi:hypothetical protein